MARCPECGMKECCGADMSPELDQLRTENRELKHEAAEGRASAEIENKLRLEAEARVKELEGLAIRAYECDSQGPYDELVAVGKEIKALQEGK